MSVGIRVAVIVLAVAGLLGLASAQTYYPPPPPGNYRPLPVILTPPPPDYNTPVPPTDVGGPSDQPYYGAGMEEPGQGYSQGYSPGYSPEYPPPYPPPYPPERRAYGVPADRSVAHARAPRTATRFPVPRDMSVADGRRLTLPAPLANWPPPPARRIAERSSPGFRRKISPNAGQRRMSRTSFGASSSITLPPNLREPSSSILAHLSLFGARARQGAALRRSWTRKDSP